MIIFMDKPKGFYDLLRINSEQEHILF